MVAKEIVMTNDPLKPSVSLLSKIGSILVHVEELTSPSGHIFDHEAFKSAMRDPEVVEWMTTMDKMAFLPKKR